jgi:hypothetical protein
MIVKLSRRTRKPIGLQWMQAGDVLPINCTGFSCVVHVTTLPYLPQISPVDLAQGRFDIIAPTAEQMALLDPTENYTLSINLVNALGEGVEEMDLSMGVAL